MKWLFRWAEKNSKKIEGWVDKGKAYDAKVDAWVKSHNPYDPEKLKTREDMEPVVIEESEIRQKAAKFFLISFGIFLIWAILAPIDQGIVVPGNVTVMGNRQSVQHPTGGVITEIVAKEGDVVEQGAILVRVNPLNTEANLTGAELQYINTLATESRLKSERDSKSAITWSDELEKFKDNPRVKEAKDIQTQMFKARRAEYINSLAAKKVQVETLTQEAANTQQLAKEGFIPRAQANQILRNKVEAEASISQLQNGYLKDIDNQLAEAQKNREALQLKVQSLTFEADLNNVKSPVSGTVVGIKVNTVGGVITASQVLMEVIPRERMLVVEAKVPTNLIDKVKVGQEADLRFSAFNTKKTPVVPGLVKYVGADKVASDKAVDIASQNNQGEYYVARIETTEKAMMMLKDNEMLPGMPVEVIVKGGERSFMSYVLKPLTDSLASAFLN